MGIADLPGVEVFDHNKAVDEALDTIICSVFGASKSGKTDWSLQCERPLFVVYADPNATLDYMLLKIEERGFVGDVYKLVIPPMMGKSYEDFTQADAKAIVKRVEDFAAAARAEAAERRAKGEPTGTFLVDGMTMIKGYFEKAILGESITLGWRPEKGSRSINRYEYAKPNAALRDFTMQFSGSKMDVIFTWEGRPIWGDDKPTGRFRSTRPDMLPFCIGIEVETIKIIEPVVENQVKVGEKIVPSIRIGWNAFDMDLENRVMRSKGFAGLKRLLLVDVPAKVELDLKPLGAVVEVVNTEALS